MLTSGPYSSYPSACWPLRWAKRPLARPVARAAVATERGGQAVRPSLRGAVLPVGCVGWWPMWGWVFYEKPLVYKEKGVKPKWM